MDNYTLPLEAVVKQERLGDTAQQRVYAFAEWANQNPEAIRAMYRKALHLASNKYISVNYLFMWLRHESGVRINGVAEPTGYKAPNHFATIFARYLVEQNPGLEELIRLNPSMYDNPQLDFPDIDWGYPK